MAPSARAAPFVPDFRRQQQRQQISPGQRVQIEQFPPVQGQTVTAPYPQRQRATSQWEDRVGESGQ